MSSLRENYFKIDRNFLKLLLRSDYYDTYTFRIFLLYIPLLHIF